MKKLLLFTTSLVLLVGGHAFGQDVRYNFDKDADFSRFKTYHWVLIKDADKVDDITDKQVKAAVDAELAKKGLTKSDGDDADLFVGYQPAVSAEKEFTSYNSGWGHGPGWYGGGWYGSPGGMTTGQTSTIHVGQLSLDMYDSAKKNLVWRGVVSKTLDPKAKPEKRQKNLNKAVAKLLKNYPPSKKE
jgi:hypothetical protein